MSSDKKDIKNMETSDLMKLKFSDPGLWEQLFAFEFPSENASIEELKNFAKLCFVATLFTKDASRMANERIINCAKKQTAKNVKKADLSDGNDETIEWSDEESDEDENIDVKIL
jgi:hypothetical protein